MAKKVTFHDVGKRLSAKQLRAVEHLLCPLSPGLPLDYRRFILKYNGGRPEPAHFRWRQSGGEWQTSQVYAFYGIDPGRLDESSLDCVRSTLQYRCWLPRDAISIASLELSGNLLLLYTAGPREGQIWYSNASDFLDVDPELAVSFVAKNFARFLELLHQPVVRDPYEPKTFALDSPRVRGQRLEAILKSIGCKRKKYPGISSQTPLPTAWHWPKYESTQDVGGPAFLSVEKNRTYGYAPQFDERPAGHKMLCVNVTKRQRSKCLRELATALGEGAVLLDGD
jgi:hypothetical protein